MRAAQISTLLLAIALSGCSVATRSLADWKPMGKEGPWSGRGTQATLESREYFVSAMADVQGHDERWRAPNGQTIDAWKVCERLVDYLIDSGEFGRWPQTQSYVYKVGAQRLGPYTIHLVSLFPAVAILVPHDYGPLKNRSNYDLVGMGHDTFGDRRMLNYIRYGTAIPSAPTLFWVSADLNVPVTPVVINAESVFTIRHSKFELVGLKTSYGFSTERLK